MFPCSIIQHGFSRTGLPPPVTRFAKYSDNYLFRALPYRQCSVFNCVWRAFAYLRGRRYWTVRRVPVRVRVCTCVRTVVIILVKFNYILRRHAWSDIVNCAPNKIIKVKSKFLTKNPVCRFFILRGSVYFSRERRSPGRIIYAFFREWSLAWAVRRIRWSGVFVVSIPGRMCLLLPSGGVRSTFYPTTAVLRICGRGERFFTVKILDRPNRRVYSCECIFYPVYRNPVLRN